MRMDLPASVAADSEFAQGLPEDASFARIQVVGRTRSRPGSKYSAKFCTAVRFSPA